LNALQRHRIGDRPFELRDVVDAADAVVVEAVLDTAPVDA